MNETSAVLTADVGAAVLAFLLNVVIAIVLLVVGWWFSAKVADWLRVWVQRHPRTVDPTIVPMIATVAMWLIRFLVVIAVLARFGIQTASLVALLGAAGLAIGLALQGTLQNIAAGVMLLFLRLVKAGEYIAVNGVAEGTVEEIGLFVTRLRQFDGVCITLPNSTVWGGTLINYSRNPTRRLDVAVGIRYGDDIERALSLLQSLATGHAQALSEPAPQVMVSEYRDNVVIINVRIWATSDDYWPLRWDIFRRARQVLDQAGYQLPVPVRVMLPADGEAGESGNTKVD